MELTDWETRLAARSSGCNEAGSSGVSQGRSALTLARTTGYDVGMTNTHYTDAHLQTEAASRMAGTARQASLLLALGTEADWFDLPRLRSIFVQEMRYRLNTEGQGWRPSDMLARILNEYEASTPDKEIQIFRSPAARSRFDDWEHDFAAEVESTLLRDANNL